MMSVIYKYPFKVTDEFTLELPEGAQILLVECQNGNPCIWAKIHPRRYPVLRRFRIVGTGHVFDDDRMEFIATFQQPPFVWHLFEV